MTITTGLQISLTIFYTGIFLIGAPLNIAILHLMLSRQGSRTPITNCFLTSLLTATILSCMSGCPYYLVSLLAELPPVNNESSKEHLPACRAAIFFNYSLAASKVLSLTLLSLDRFVAIIWPYFYVNRVTKMRAFVLIVFIWIQALVTALPLPIMPGWVSYIAVHGAACGYEWEISDRGFLVPVLLLDFVMPAIILVVANVSVFVVARKQKLSIRQSIRLSQEDEKSRGKMLLVKTLAKAITLMDMSGADQSKTDGGSNNETEILTVASRKTKDKITIWEDGDISKNGSEPQSPPNGYAKEKANADKTRPQGVVNKEIMTRKELGVHNGDRCVYCKSEPEDTPKEENLRKVNENSIGMENGGLDTNDVRANGAIHEEITSNGSNVYCNTGRNSSVEDGERIEDVQIDVDDLATGGDKLDFDRSLNFNMKKKLEKSDELINRSVTDSPKSQVQRFLTKNGLQHSSPEPKRAKKSSAERGKANSVSSFEADDFTRLQKNKRLKILSDPSSHIQQLKTLQLRKMQPSLVLSTILLVLFFLLTWLPFIISRIIRLANVALSEEMVSIPAAITNLDVILNPVVILATRKGLRRRLLRKFLSILRLTGGRRTQA
ncbi:uncharacterized protein LOC135694727 [Rhopilema esculentum]|uniref:uncharacterized protein LOC135694727 n=1 Tax=Rhopilema esculentum TaxID=499914 RepID=UPI0031CF9089|eukprot:gene4484-20727_t